MNLHRLAPGAESYYLDQVVSGIEDYYGESGEAPGYWLASSAQLMALEGRVDSEDLRAVLSGHDPSTGERLHRSHNRKVPGWDLTFRAPKSVAVLWALGGPGVAAEVVAAHEAAVARAMSYMEEACAWTRTGRNGLHRVQAGGFVAAGFRHRTSRDRDPLVHTHVLVANSVRADDGRWRTIDATALYDHARTGGYLYQAQLRHELTGRLGVSWRPVVNGLADVDGIDDGLIGLFSKRRERIEATLAEWGLSSARAAQVSTLETRQVKGDRPEGTSEQFARWRSEAIDAGYGPAVVVGVVAAAPSGELGADHPSETAVVRGGHGSDRGSGGGVVSPDRQLAEVDAEASTRVFEVLSSSAGLTVHRSTFDRRDVLCRLAEELPAYVGVDAIEAMAEAYLLRPEVVMVGWDERCGTSYSTVELMELERRLVDQATASTRGRCGLASDQAVAMALAARPSISDEQAEVVTAMCRSGHQVDVLVAAAGTGKTFSLDAAREAWQRSGLHVTGCALAAAAAHELQAGAGIESTTIAKLQLDLDRGERQLDARSVLVVDEAGMVGTRTIAPLIDTAMAAGAKVVLVGDPKQLPEITAGGLLASLERRDAVLTLVENRRQQDPIERSALHQLRNGDVADAVTALRVHGNVVAAPDAEAARNAIVADWYGHGERGESALMMARRNSDVDDLNRRARRLVADELSGEPIVVAGRPFQVGDQVVCTRNDHPNGIRNGTVGTIVDIDHRRHAIALAEADGAIRRLDREYLDAGWMRHGYAVTVHKAQGRTVDHGLLLASDDLHREAGYVGLSRGRESNCMYLVSTEPADELEPHTPFRGETVDPYELVTQALGRSGAKSLATDQAEEDLGADDDLDLGW
ncbi:MAG: MobF family relaxase [Microthrixaceae bacterium]